MAPFELLGDGALNDHKWCHLPEIISDILGHLATKLFFEALTKLLDIQANGIAACKWTSGNC